MGEKLQSSRGSNWRDSAWEAYRMVIIEGSGIRRRFLGKSFADFTVTRDNERALTACREYADRFCAGTLSPDERNGLFIVGPAGTGKTHLAAAIANQVLETCTPVICRTMADILADIRETYGRDSRRTEAQAVGRYREIPLLIIDDLGKEAPTEWALTALYSIVNARYEDCLPTVLTTNYGDAQLVRRLTPAGGDSVTAEAVIDRLREMCIGIVTAGESWRSK